MQCLSFSDTLTIKIEDININPIYKAHRAYNRVPTPVMNRLKLARPTVETRKVSVLRITYCKSKESN